MGVPGVGSFEHYRASKDLRGDEFDPREPGGDGAGSWEQFTRKLRHRREPVVVLSDELMCGLSPEQVERAVQSLAPREVHTIYVMRGLHGLLPSYWQELVKHGGKRPYPRWVRAVLSDRERPFWQLEDAASVMGRWGAWVAPECQHVITLPPGSAGQRELWRRFASVIGVEELPVAFPEAPSNRSLGLAETELLRQVNVELDGSLERWQRSALVREVLSAQILSASSEPGVPALPEDVAAKVEARQAEIVDGLEAVGCEVVGSFDDLRPHRSRGSALTSGRRAAAQRRRAGDRRSPDGDGRAAGGNATRTNDPRAGVGSPAQVRGAGSGGRGRAIRTPRLDRRQAGRGRPRPAQRSTPLTGADHLDPHRVPAHGVVRRDAGDGE